MSINQDETVEDVDNSFPPDPLDEPPFVTTVVVVVIVGGTIEQFAGTTRHVQVEDLSKNGSTYCICYSLISMQIFLPHFQIYRRHRDSDP